MLVNSIIRLPRSAWSRVRVSVLRLLGMKIGKNVWLRKISVPRNPWDIHLQDNVALDDYVTLLTTGERQPSHRILIGKSVYINRFTMIDAAERVFIGEQTMIGPYCYITDHDHGIAPGKPINLQTLVSAPVEIGQNVWIGAGVKILKGVCIGDGAVVAAGAVVTRSVPAGDIVAGIPARRIGTRCPRFKESEAD